MVLLGLGVFGVASAGAGGADPRPARRRPRASGRRRLARDDERRRRPAHRGAGGAPRRGVRALRLGGRRGRRDRPGRRRPAHRAPSGWRAIFLVNVPVVLTAVVLVVRTVPARDVSAGHAGAGTAPGAWRRTLRLPSFAAATGAQGLSNVAMYATLLAVPVVLSHRPGWSASDAGLALAIMSVAMVAVSPFGGRIAGRLGYRLPAVAGLALLTASTAALAVMGGDPSAVGLAAALLTAGIGLGLAGAPLQAAAVEAVDPRDAGVASGLFSTGRYMGSIVSAGLLAALLGSGAGHPAALFAITAAAALAATVLALRLGGARARTRCSQAPSADLLLEILDGRLQRPQPLLEDHAVGVLVVAVVLVEELAPRRGAARSPGPPPSS